MTETLSVASTESSNTLPGCQGNVHYTVLARCWKCTEHTPELQRKVCCGLFRLVEQARDNGFLCSVNDSQRGCLCEPLNFWLAKISLSGCSTAPNQIDMYVGLLFPFIDSTAAP